MAMAEAGDMADVVADVGAGMKGVDVEEAACVLLHLPFTGFD